MTGAMGLYVSWIGLLAILFLSLRQWYAADASRSQLVLWVLLFLACPPFALALYCMTRLVSVRVENNFGNSKNG